MAEEERVSVGPFFKGTNSIHESRADHFLKSPTLNPVALGVRFDLCILGDTNIQIMELDFYASTPHHP